MSDDVIPLVIAGCGPAGLAAACVVQKVAPDLQWFILEAGDSLAARRRDDPRDISEGVGGAGLYSDGKFSFYPAATALWQLADTPRLQRAYARVTEMFSQVGARAPAFPQAPQETEEPQNAYFKPYPSLYLDLPTRRALIERLYQPVADRVLLKTRLLDIAPLPDGTLKLSVERQKKRSSLRARILLGAGGRFFPLLLSRCAAGSLPTHFLRWELGIRIEGAAQHPFFTALLSQGKSNDPKLILRDEAKRLEWRTFCCCIEGEVVGTWCEDLFTLSGRADCASTGKSNIGFNVRFLEEGIALDLARLKRKRPFHVTLSEARNKPSVLDAVYGAQAAEALREGLSRLCAHLPVLEKDSPTLFALGPTLEGVGRYPATEPDLSLAGWPMYFAGDACGKFRGLVAAMVSGAYAGEAAAQHAARLVAGEHTPGYTHARSHPLYT